MSMPGVSGWDLALETLCPQFWPQSLLSGDDQGEIVTLSPSWGSRAWHKLPEQQRIDAEITLLLPGWGFCCSSVCC